MDDSMLKDPALGEAAEHATAAAPATQARRGGSKKTVGIVGWRGMVGSVLMERMTAEGDFAEIEPVFFSTSNAGGEGPLVGGRASGKLQDANSVEALSKLDVIL